MASQRTRDQQYRYVRQVGGNKWQARVWINSESYHLNLGLHDSERKAWMVAKAYINKGIIPPGVMPKFVRRVAGRPDQFIASVKLDGVLYRVGPFDSAGKAHQAFLEMMKPVRERHFRELMERKRQRREERAAEVIETRYRLRALLLQRDCSADEVAAECGVEATTLTYFGHGGPIGLRDLSLVRTMLDRDNVSRLPRCVVASPSVAPQRQGVLWNE
jgi:Trp operon repressor